MCTENFRFWFQVNFGYIEHGMKKNALVKLSKEILADCKCFLSYNESLMFCLLSCVNGKMCLQKLLDITKYQRVLC